MLKLKATWNIPGDIAAERVDERFFGTHLELVRRLPGLARHHVLRCLEGAHGARPAWWRGEELWFADRQALEAAVAAPEWSRLAADGVGALAAGLRRDAFEIEEEHVPAAAAAGGPAAGDRTPVALSGVWQVPAALTPEQVDPVYLDVHVPNVRRLPRLRRHTVMRAIDWPPGEHARFWRSAEIRFDSLEDFRAAYASPEYDVVRRDGFARSVCGPEVDVFAIEQEWRPAAGDDA